MDGDRRCGDDGGGGRPPRQAEGDQLADLAGAASAWSTMAAATGTNDRLGEPQGGDDGKGVNSLISEMCASAPGVERRAVRGARPGRPGCAARPRMCVHRTGGPSLGIGGRDHRRRRHHPVAKNAERGRPFRVRPIVPSAGKCSSSQNDICVMPPVRNRTPVTTRSAPIAFDGGAEAPAALQNADEGARERRRDEERQAEAEGADLQESEGPGADRVGAAGDEQDRREHRADARRPV